MIRRIKVTIDNRQWEWQIQNFDTFVKVEEVME